MLPFVMATQIWQRVGDVGIVYIFIEKLLFLFSVWMNLCVWTLSFNFHNGDRLSLIYKNRH